MAAARVGAETPLRVVIDTARTSASTGNAMPRRSVVQTSRPNHSSWAARRLYIWALT